MATTRWGILGTGGIAAAFAEALSGLEHAELTAVGSRSAQKAETFARRFGAKRAHASYEALARDAEIDVVYVATPNSAHMANCVLLLEHGKHVLCEKPFTLNAGEARTVIETARRAGLFCMEGMWMRFTPLVREVKRRVQDGAIGDLRMVQASLGFAARFDPTHRVFDPALGGGALLDLGVYPLSFVHHLLGRPTALSAYARLGQTGVDEQAMALLQFPEGRQACIATSLRFFMSNDATLFGTHGIIRIEAPIYCPETATITRTGQPAEIAGGRGGLVQGAKALLRRPELAALRASPLVRDLRTRVQRLRGERTLTLRRQGNGFAHEALEVMRCLAAGERESPIMPLDETLSIMETMDALHAQWREPPQPSEAKGPTCASPS